VSLSAPLGIRIRRWTRAWVERGRGCVARQSRSTRAGSALAFTADMASARTAVVPSAFLGILTHVNASVIKFTSETVAAPSWASPGAAECHFA
jgi:hypothetical protein